MAQIPSEYIAGIRKRALSYSAFLVILGSIVLAGLGHSYRTWYVVIPWTVAFVAASWFIPLAARNRKVDAISDVALIDEEVDLDSYPKKEMVWQIAGSRAARLRAVEAAIISAIAMSALVWIFAALLLLLHPRLQSPPFSWQASIGITVVVAIPIFALCRIVQASWVLRKWNSELANY